MSIKIGLTGTQCSGKSTLATELQKVLPDAVVVGSVARLCPFKINEDTTYDAQNWIITTRIKMELEAKKQNPHYIICERTVLDDYAYFYKKYYDEQSGKEQENDYAHISSEIQTSIVLNWMKTYDHLFYLEPLPLVDDTIRSMNKVFQDEIDAIIWEGVTSLKHKRLTPVEVAERVNEAIQYIKDGEKDV